MDVQSRPGPRTAPCLEPGWLRVTALVEMRPCRGRWALHPILLREGAAWDRAEAAAGLGAEGKAPVRGDLGGGPHTLTSGLGLQTLGD